MILDKAIEDVTIADCDERFGSGGWTKAGGNFQSMQFALEIWSSLLSGELAAMWERLRHTQFVLLDYGCAEGDGTALLQATFPSARIIGIDISSAAIERAKARWPTVEFMQGNIENPVHDCTLAFTSHTLEHMLNPPEVIKRLQEKCAWLVVGVPPTCGGEKDPTHLHAMPYHDWIVQTNPITEELLKTKRIWQEECTETETARVIEWTQVLVYRGAYTSPELPIGRRATIVDNYVEAD